MGGYARSLWGGPVLHSPLESQGVASEASGIFAGLECEASHQASGGASQLLGHMISEIHIYSVPYLNAQQMYLVVTTWASVFTIARFASCEV